MAEAIYTEAQWNEAKACYFSGSYKSLEEMAKRIGINPTTLRSTIAQKGWKEERALKLTRIEQKIDKKVENAAELYLKEKFIRLKRYETIINSSIDQLSAKDSEGIPVIDALAIDQYTKSESRLHEMAKSCLGIRESSSVDVTSKGQSLGESFVDALAKLREANLPRLTAEDAKRIREAEIIEE